jgi:hypothetical protein
MVWEPVVARAGQADGSAPVDGLDLGSGESAKTWQGRFARCVEDDARQRGLIGPRAPMWVPGLLGLALVVPAVLAGAAAVAAHHSGAIVYLVLGFLLVLRTVGVLRVPVPSGAGVQAAADCREIRRRLAAHAPAVPAEPGDRTAGYATALGVLGRSTPLAGASDTLVWSSLGGSWRQVRIVAGRGTYFDMSPKGAFAFLAGTPFFVIWFVLLTWFTTLLTPTRWERVWPPLLVFTGWGLWVLGIFLILRVVWRGAYDLTHPALVLTGPVIYLYSDTGGDSSTYWFAVDTGGAQAVRYPTGAATYGRLTVGTVLRLEVTPKLGHVRRCEIVATPAPQPVD